MTRVEYAINTYKNLTLEEVEEFHTTAKLLPDNIDQYAEAIRRVLRERPEDGLMSIKEVADFLDIKKQTVTRLERDGCFYRLNDKGHPIYSYDEIKEFSRGYKKNRRRK